MPPAGFLRKRWAPSPPRSNSPRPPGKSGAFFDIHGAHVIFTMFPRMLDGESIPLPSCRVSSLNLGWGLDAQSCDDDDPIEISERGMFMRSRWHFEIGTRLAVSFVSEPDRPGARRLTAEGIVVWCERCKSDPCGFESTVLFLELPDELKQSLRELSYRLATARG